MPIARPFAYNPSQTPISGATQSGNLAIATQTLDWNSTGLSWWMGPDEENTYIVAAPYPAGDFPTPIGNVGTVSFWSSPKTDSAFIALARQLLGSSYASASLASSALFAAGYWTSYQGIIENGLIIQLDADNSVSYPGAGTTVFDLTTNSYNHTLTDGASFTTLNGIKCFDCTSSTESVVVNDTGPTLPTSGYTYITWARVEEGNPLSFRTLLYTNSPKYTPITIPNGTNTLGYWDTEFRSSGYDLSSSVGVWVQYAIVGDSSSQTFYINDSQVGSPIAFGSGGRTHWGWGNNNVPQPWGYVANLYLYDRKLSLSEISQQYNFLSSRFLPYSAGLFKTTYSGYFSDDVSFFATATPASVGGNPATSVQTTAISEPAADDGSSFSCQWLGYFKPTTTETYTFFTSSDDASYVWIGANAQAGFTTGNATVNNGGLHGNLEKFGTIALTAGVYYPIRIQFGELSGGDVMTFSYSTPTITKTTNVTGLVFYNSSTNGF